LKEQLFSVQLEDADSSSNPRWDIGFGCFKVLVLKSSLIRVTNAIIAIVIPRYLVSKTISLTS
jgi:hypothetical protein